MSLYEYVGSGPVSGVDPSGLLFNPHTEINIVDRWRGKKNGQPGEYVRLRISYYGFWGLDREESVVRFYPDAPGLWSRTQKEKPDYWRSGPIGPVDPARVDPKTVITILEYTEEGLRLLPGGESGYHLSQGNYGQAVFHYGVDVLGSVIASGAGKAIAKIAPKAGRAGAAIARAGEKLASRTGSRAAQQAIRNIAAKGAAAANMAGRVIGSPPARKGASEAAGYGIGVAGHRAVDTAHGG